MKEKLESLNFKYRVVIFTFILFLLIEALSPISGADWRSYVIGKGGISSSLNNINILDGRIISGFLVNFFSYNKILFDLFFAFMVSQFVKIINDVMGQVKTRFLYLYPLIGLLLVSVFTFSYNYLSVTTTVTYTFPAFIFFYYFYTLLKDESISKLTLFKLLLCTIFISLSTIHFAIIFFVVNFVYFLLNDKKKNRAKYFSILTTSFILVIISLFSLKNSLFYNSFNSIKDNIPYMIEHGFSNNIILLILGAIPINMYLYEELKENTYVRVVITIFDLILLFSLSYNFYGYSPVNLNLIISKYSGVFATENWYYIFYYISYYILFILSINHYIKNNKVKRIFNMFMIASILMIIFSLVSPLFDVGNIIMIVFIFIFITIITAKDANTKVFIKLVRISIIVLSIYYLSLFSFIKYIDVTRTSYIKEQVENNAKVIEVKANPTYMIWRYNPVDYFQLDSFKAYYDIPSKCTIDVKYFGLLEKVEKRIKR